MDFSTIDLKKASDKGAACHLKHPVHGTLLYTEDGKKITITVLGRDSSAFRNAIAEMNEREAGPSTMDTNDANAVELLSAVTTGWDNITWGDKPLEFTPENVRMFLTKFPPIRAQLDAFIAKRANFFADAKSK